MVIASAKLTRKYQITLPAQIRKRLDLKAGDVVYLTYDEHGEVVLRGMRGGWVAGSRGLGEELWREAGGGETVIQAERESWK